MIIAESLAFARTLRGGFAAVESEFGLVDDPDGSIARARMALVYGNDATTFFFGLLDNTFVTEVPYDHPQSTLEQLILDAAPGRIAYDDFRKVLAYTGVLDEHARDTLIDFGTTSTFQAAVHIPQAEGGTLYAENQKVIAPFFDHYPELRPLYEAYAFFGELKNWVDYPHSEETLASSIMEAYANHIAYDPQLKRLSFKGVMSGDTHTELITGVSAEFLTAVEALFSANQQAIQSFFQGFFKPDPNEAASQEAQKQAYLAANDSVEKRRSLLLAAFLPELIRLRKRQQALQAISAATGSDIAFASALLDNNLVLNPAAAPEAAALDKLPAALDDLTAMEAGGATLPFTPASAVWSGYLEVPENGFYNFYIETAGAVSPKLTLDGEDRLLQPPEPNAPGWSNKGAIELRAGTLYALTLEVQSIAGDLKVRWESKGRGREVIPSRFLYPATLTDALRTTYIRFLKAVSLASALKLTPAETVHFAAYEAYRIDKRGRLQRLPVNESPPAARSILLFRALDALIDFSLLKAKLAPNDERLLTVLKDPAATIEKTDQTTESLLFALTRWDEPSLDELLVRFGKVLAGGPAKADREALKDLDTFVRVNRAYGPVKKIAVSAAALINAATNAPDGASVRAFKAALRARYDETDWLGVLRPINDALRALQRDALVAYILQRMSLDPKARHIDTPDKLFEYFLMDVQMDPCMQTSRIRHALSSVQLFIERSLLSLEPRVAPKVFSRDHCKQWAWMKRYRVWEANRKVFLWPENWLWPELRDDQSPIFKEAMSELLQSDITEDRAATALLNYLSKLEEVAKLEPCGIHYVEGVPGASNPVAHVVARTAGANRKYYYRRREGLAGVGEGSWTPWEQIKLDIEDNPVIPVVWKGRLFLFWLKILKQTPLSGQQLETGGTTKLQDLPPTAIRTEPPKVTVQAMLCWSEYYNGKWQPTKTSNVNQPIVLEQSDPTGPNAFDRSTLVLWAMKATEERALLVYSVYSSAGYTLYNSHSLPVRDEDGGSDMMASAMSIFSTQRFRQLEPGSDPFTIAYQTGLYPFVEETGMVSLPVLQAKDAMRCCVVDPLHNLQNMWQAPFSTKTVVMFFMSPQKRRPGGFIFWTYTTVPGQRPLVGGLHRWFRRSDPRDRGGGPRNQGGDLRDQGHTSSG